MRTAKTMNFITRESTEAKYFNMTNEITTGVPVGSNPEYTPSNTWQSGFLIVEIKK